MPTTRPAKSIPPFSWNDDKIEIVNNHHGNTTKDSSTRHIKTWNLSFFLLLFNFIFFFLLIQRRLYGSVAHFHYYANCDTENYANPLFWINLLHTKKMEKIKCELQFENASHKHLFWMRNGCMQHVFSLNTCATKQSNKITITRIKESY